MIISNFEQLKPFRNKSGIYIFINKKDPTRRYVGKSINLYKRIAYDHNEAKNYKNQYIDNAIKKHGLLKSFDIEILHWWDCFVDNSELLALEVAAIDAYQSLEQNGGYNLCLFSNDRAGILHTQATKRKMSDGRRKGQNNANYNPITFKFRHRITNQTFYGNRCDFEKAHGLSKTQIYHLIHKIRKSSNDWILV